MQESAGDTGTLLKWQHTNFIHSNSLWAPVEQNSIMWGESGVCGSGMEVTGQPSGSLCWVFLLYCRSHLSWVENSPPGGIVLEKSNSPLLWTPYLSQPVELNQAEEYSQRLFQWLSLTGSQQAEAGVGSSHWGGLELVLIYPWAQWW